MKSWTPLFDKYKNEIDKPSRSWDLTKDLA